MAKYVTKKAIKTYVAKMGLRCPDRTVNGLDKVIEELLKKAVKRAKANGRKTLREEDL